MNPSNSDDSTAELVDIERVMQDVRREILERKLPGQVRRQNAADGQLRDYYEELFLASLSQNRADMNIQVVPSRLPIVGRLFDIIRGKLHELVIYYVNLSAINQAKINKHILTALSLLSPAESSKIPPALGSAGEGVHEMINRNGPATIGDVHAGFRLFHGRDPEVSDLEYWTHQIGSRNITRAELIDSFLGEYETHIDHVARDTNEDLTAIP